MRKYLLLASLFMWAASAFVSDGNNLADEFDWVPNVAEYQGAKWDNLVKIERNISIERAYEIAASDYNINYFFYTTGVSLILQTPLGWQIFRNGDVAFFSGSPWWGEANGLADGYIKKNQ